MAASEPEARGVLPEGGERERDPWTALYEDHYEEVRRYFARRVRCSHDVEDLVQDVFVEVLAHFANVLYPRLYVRTVAKHQLYTYWRGRRKSLMIEHFLLDADGGPAGGMCWNCAPDPLEQLLRKETTGIVGSMVDCLTPALAEALRLRFLRGMRIDEAAVQAGCSREALKKRLKRARRSIIDLYS